MKRHDTPFEFAEDLCQRFKVAAVEALQRQHWDAPATRQWNDVKHFSWTDDLVMLPARRVFYWIFRSLALICWKPQTSY